MQELEFSLRGKTIKGVVTDDDAFFFCSHFYNERELKLSVEGKEQEAIESLSDRFRERMENAENSKAGSDAIASDMAFKIRREISHNWETRKIVTWRLIECFPNMPEEMIYWHSDRKFGIRLDIIELIEVFMRVVTVVMEKLENGKQEKAETTAVEQIVPEVILMPEDNGPKVSSEIEQLEAKIASLKNVQSRSK